MSTIGLALKVYSVVPCKNILIPVHTPEHALIAVERAFELYPFADTTLYLSGTGCVQRKWSLLKWRKTVTAVPDHAMINKLAAKIRSVYPGSRVLVETPADEQPDEPYYWQLITRHNIDLVLLVKGETENMLPSYASFPVPVLVITPGCLNHPIRSILLPVHGFVPETQVHASLMFAKKFNAQIYLVTILGSDEIHSKQHVDAFYLTYKLLMEYGHTPYYKILQGSHDTEMILRYADQVKADLLLTSLERKRSVTDLLHPLSALQVLMLKPHIK